MASPSDAEETVRLPPLIVKEPLLGPQWRTARTDRFEVLSRSPDHKARALVEAYQDAFAKLEVLLPSRYVADHDLPIQLIIYDESLWPRSTQDEVAAMLSTISERMPEFDLQSVGERRDTPFYNRFAKSANSPFDRLREPWITSEVEKFPFERDRAGPPEDRASVFFTDLRLTDLDQVVIFSLAPAGYNTYFSISLRSTLVAHLMGKRTPTLPPWFTRGFLEVYREIDFTSNGLRLPRMELETREETESANSDPFSLTKTFVPILDLLSDSRPENDFSHRNRQLGLFIRWALDPGNDRAAGLWTLVDESCHQAVHEAALERAFGIGSAELDQLLRDYAAVSLRRSMRWPPPEVDHLKVAFERAIGTEVARIKGNWERLETNWVRHNHRELVDQYARKAGASLNRGGWRGDQDPHLLANRALFAFEAGDIASATTLLKMAMELEHPNALRPRAYLVLAQAHWARWQSDNRGMEHALPVNIAAPWLDLLRTAAQGTPLMLPVYHTYLEIIETRRQRLTDADIQFLLKGIEAFPREPSLISALAEHYRLTGEAESARNLVDRAISLGAKVPLESR